MEPLLVDINDIIEKQDDKLENEFKSTADPKPKKPRAKLQKKEALEQYTINYENFVKHSLVLTKYKLPELKEAAKLHKLLISGTKPVLIERLESNFRKVMYCHVIQRYFRGWLARRSILLRGPAVRNRELCNNDKDFVTMEPLTEIPNESFFSYTDNQNFIYGFNIISLIQSFKAKGSLMNPYNREKFNSSMVNKILALYRISRILYEEFRKETEEINIHSHNNTRPRVAPPQPVQHYELSSIITNNYQPMVNRNSLVSTEDINRYNKMCEIRAKPVQQRINHLFVEFDHLGNYTNSEWFSSLNIRDYIRLYRIIYDIWNYRQLSREIRNRICPFHEPFDGIFPRPVQHNELTLAQIQKACLIVFENLVYSGAEEETRKIGAFHALSGLTTVSPRARAAMPWLYDSVIF